MARFRKQLKEPVMMCPEAVYFNSGCGFNDFFHRLITEDCNGLMCVLPISLQSEERLMKTMTGALHLECPT